MLADAADLTGSPAARGPGPSLAFGQAMTPDAARQAMQRAAETGDSLSYSGLKSFYGSRGGRTMAAVIQIESRTGQGSQIKVRSRTGQSLLGGFSPASLPSRVVDDELVTLLEHNYDLSGIDSAFVAGRRAAVVAASRQGRVAARWWLDDATGLVLWQETYDEQGCGRAVVRVHLDRDQPVRGTARPSAAAADDRQHHHVMDHVPRHRAQRRRAGPAGPNWPGCRWSGCTAIGPRIPRPCTWSTATG